MLNENHADDDIYFGVRIMVVDHGKYIIRIRISRLIFLFSVFCNKLIGLFATLINIVTNNILF